MLYYLTGMATERSAVLAYNLLHDGVIEIGEHGRRADRDRADQAPGARPLRLLPALGARPLGRSSPPGSGGWCAGCASLSFAPVGANNDDAEGRLRRHAGDAGHRPSGSTTSPRQISRVERELLWAHRRGLTVPPYVARRSARRWRRLRRRDGGRAADPGRRGSRRALLVRQRPQRAAGEPGDAVGGLGRRAGRLHDVAEHDPHDHVDRRPRGAARRARGRTARPARSPPASRPRSSESACVVSSGSSSVSAPWVADTTACSSLLSLGELEHAVRRRADRVDQVVGDGASKAADDHGEEALQLAQDHRLGEPVLGAELVVDGLPADADPLGERAHGHAGPARTRWSSRPRPRRSARASSGPAVMAPS